MKKNFFLILTFFFTFFCFAKSQKKDTIYFAKILKRGVINVIPENLNKKEIIFNAEASGVTFVNGNLFIGNDKSIPDASPIFKIPCNNNFQLDSIFFIENETILNTKKIEDLSCTIDEKFIIAISGFDRVRKKNNSWDNYNNIIFWKNNFENNVKIISPIENNKIISSVNLREHFLKLLESKKFQNGINYFKIEGLAVLPENKLLFGIREIGKNYTDFEYTITLIAVDYFIENETIKLKNNFELLYKFTKNNFPEINEEIGVSSLEYDKYNDKIYLLVSYELAEIDIAMGGYLLEISMSDFNEKKDFKIVKDENNKAIHFAHKSEGIAIIDKNTIFVIHDDDRVTGRKNPVNLEKEFFRKNNQAAFTVIKKIKIKK